MIDCPYCNSDYQADDIGRVVFTAHLGEVHRKNATEARELLEIVETAKTNEVSLEFMEAAHQWWDDNLNEYP